MQELRDEYMRKSYENNHSFKDPETCEMVILGPPTLVQEVLQKWRAHEDMMAALDAPLPDRMQRMGVSTSARPHRGAQARGRQ